MNKLLCVKCRKIAKEGQNKIQCNICKNWSHLKCTSLSLKDFKKQTSTSFNCQYCISYKCGKCSDHVLDNHNGISCDTCNIWFHLKCTKLTTKDYRLYQTGQYVFWNCPKCLSEIFPFTNIDNNKFKSLC